MTDFLGILESCLKKTRLFPGEDLMIEVFLNPAAGLLGDKKRLDALLASWEKIPPLQNEENPERTVSVEIHRTESREENLREIVRAVEKLEQFSQGTDGGTSPRSLLLTAGGDGFHKDCVTHLLREKPRAFRNIILFRLPLGTGNDTPLVTDPLKALTLLREGVQPVADSYIRTEIADGTVDYALNVVSFGLDAYVCLLLERWKGKVKGDIYKVMVDISTLLYDFYHRTQVSRLTLFVGEGDSRDVHPVKIEKRILINVFGRRGQTTYGGGKKILPGPENHLVTGMFRLPGRIMLKGLFMKGRHWPGGRRVSFFRTEKMVLDYPAPLLMELDGEVVYLQKEDFPLTLTRVDGEILVLN